MLSSALWHLREPPFISVDFLPLTVLQWEMTANEFGVSVRGKVNESIIELNFSSDGTTLWISQISIK